jgi:Family of unknown function (DUF5906)
MLIENRLMFEGGWIDKEGMKVFNLYRPPNIVLGDWRKAGPWLRLVHRLYPIHGRKFVQWLAFKVQFPGIKINHGIVMGGRQGIGKDSILEPVKRAIGPWNFREANPTKMFANFNEFQQGVILRINEAHDMGDISRYGFYDHMKTLMASPPDTLQINDKHIKEYSILNCCGVIVTSNHKDALYLPPDDRRHGVMWSDQEPWDPKAEDKSKMLSPEYFATLWAYYESGGYEHVAAYLRSLDLKSFDPKAPPLKSDAFWEMVSFGRSSDDTELDDAIEKMGRPAALSVYGIVCWEGDSDLARRLQDAKS